MDNKKQTYWRALIAPMSTAKYLFLNLILGILLTFLTSRSSLTSLQNAFIAISWTTVISFVLWTGNAAIVQWLDKRFPWMEKPVTRSLSGLALQSLYSWVAFLCVQLLLRWIVYGKTPPEFGPWVLQWAFFAITISLGISFFFTAIGFFQAWRKSEKEAAELKTKMLAYQYEALRNQINPHFLFNSFNVLTDLIYEDQDQAARFVQQLSELYRYVLDQREKGLVTLKEELSFVQSFIFLLKTRFEDKLLVELDVEASEGEQMVPMALQLLIENAVKHNEVSKAYPLRVRVTREENSLVVYNPLRLKRTGEDSKGTGLLHLKAQFRHHGVPEVVVEQSESSFTVRIPILKGGKA